MYAKKSLGQNFLINENILKNIYNDIKKIVLENKIKYIIEIGPGYGALTKYIMQLSNIDNIQILCIEKDNYLSSILQKKYNNIINNDALLFDYDSIKTDYIVVGNIPYYISGHIFKKIILHTTNQPKYIVFMLQKEFVQKIKSNKLNKLKILINNYGKIIKTVNISKNNFKPIPKVDSSYVIIKKENEKKYENKFWKFINIAFSSPRKKLINNLSNIYEKKIVENIFESLNIDKNIRAEQLNIQTLLSIYELLKN